MDFSIEQQQVLDALSDSRESILLTGVAGCGKSTLLRHWLKHGPGARHTIVLAPTGIAALNVGGSTIHRAFGFHPRMNMDEPRISLRAKSLLYSVETIIIDEISMVRADMFHAMDDVLRSVKRSQRPFGGVRIIMVGDFWQLPPVVREEEERWLEAKHGSRAGWVFYAPCFERLNPQTFFLSESFRQSGDESFADILDLVRRGDPDVIHTINNSAKQANLGVPNIVMRLCARRADVHLHNNEGLRALGTPTVSIEPTCTGDPLKIPREAREPIVLAEGARVMITRNGAGYVNGSLGTLVNFDAQATTWEGGVVPAIEIALDSGGGVCVPREEQEVIGYTVDPETRKPHKDILAIVVQYPLALGYAMTIHKSQGQTLEHALIDLGRGAFAHGQTYVALSRITSMGGLYLSSRLTRSDLLLDPDVPAFFASIQGL